MRSFRRAVRRSRWLVVLVLLCTFSYSVEAYNYSHSYRVAHEEEKRLAEIAQRLGVPVEKLRREQPGLIDSLRDLFTDEEAEARKAGQRRVEAQLKKMAEQVEANPYRPQIEEVKNAYQSHRLDGLLRDLTQLSTTDVVSLPVASRKALLKNVRKALEEDLEPYTPDSLPPKARGKHNQLKGRLHTLYAKLRRILDDPDALSDPKLAQTLGKIAAEVNDEVHRPRRGPRFADRPLPLQLREQTVRTEEVTQPVGAPSSAMVVSRSTTPPAARRSTAAAAPEIAALAQSLGNSPARIFAHVHDNVRFDPKWGAVRSPLGTLQETEGTSWDQAWLLMELLTAAGVEAKIEWGQIEIPASLLLTLTGTSNPFDAGNLLSTGGIPAVLLTQGGQVVGARLGHVWVKAHIDYIPDRGVKPGTPDAWVRMDPSFKRYGFAAGIDVHSQVPFDLGNYLQSGTEQAPRRAYEDALWAYIRANNIDCVNLEQLKKAAQVVRERFPFVPGTFRGKILRVDGEQTTVPESFQQRLTLEVKTAAGASLVSWSTPAPAVYGKRVEIDYIGATSDDQVALDAYGGVFETPPYLVDLKPVVRVAGAPVAQGAAVGSAADTEVWVTMTAPTGPPTVVTHVTSAGERHILAADFGQIPQPVLDAHLAAQTAARAAGNASEEEAETLFLIGAQYLHNLGRDLTDLSGWKWQRLVRLGTEGLITQTGVVTTTVGGAPISFRRGQRNVDIALMPLGMVPADGRRQFRREAFELLGAQSSFLEGEVFNQVLQREGIASVSALTRAKREGQTLTRVDGGNVDAVLAQADLGADAEAEIREGVARGRIAWVAESRIAFQQWTGTGYVIEDPGTGAAAYLISGGFAGGDETGGPLEVLQDLLGDEPWLGGDSLGAFLKQLLGLGGGDVPDDEPRTEHADPINLSTGNFWRTETDLTVQARGLPIVWSRTYNSRSSYVGPFGAGWTFSFGEQLEEQENGDVLYREGDGTEHRFALNGSSYAAPPGLHLVLNADAAGYTMRSKDGRLRRFAVTGELLGLSDPNGNTITLGYVGGYLRTVTDAAGRTALTITVEDGRIVGVEDLAGRSVRYRYEGSDLVEMIDALEHAWTYSYDADHNLLSRTDPLGNVDSYAYDSLDRCFRHTDPVDQVEVFSYASLGERAVLTDRRGFDSYHEFDDRGRAVLQADPLGNISRSQWDGGNNRTSLIDSRGGVTAAIYDENGNLLSETNALNETTSYAYDPIFHQVTSTTNPLGHVVNQAYDGRGNLVEIRQVVDGTPVVETFDYDSFGLIVERVDANGSPTTYSWDVNKGNLTGQSDPLGKTTTIETDNLGRITAIVDSEGNETALGWDALDRMESFTDPYGNTTSINYDAAGHRVVMTTPQGATTTVYDAAGRQVRTTNPLGNIVRFEHDATGNPVARIDARGNRIAMSYDPLGRLLSLVDEFGQVWSHGYCAEIGAGDGNTCESTDPLGNTTRQDFDAMGRVERVTDPLGHVTRMTYDELGRQTAVTDPLGYVTRYEYDAADNLTAVVEATGVRTEYTYDQNGNLTATRDAEGKVWPRTHNVLNQLITESDPLGHSTTYTYDSLGNLATRLDPKGQLVRYEYDVRRLTAVVLPDGTRETFGYDDLGRRTSMQNSEVFRSFAYDGLGRLSQVTDHTLGQTIGYEYDANGNRTAMTGPFGRVTLLYDAKGRLVEQRDPRTGVYRFQYDALDHRTKLTYPNGVEASYQYDAASRLTSAVTRSIGQVVDGYAYTYDKAGNRTSMASLRDSVSHSYEYDPVHRLTRWQRGADRFETFSYDQIGNRITLSDDQGSVTYRYDLADRLISEVRSGESGAVETVYAWDANGNLTSRKRGTGVTTYDHDALNRLTRIVDAAGEHSYGYDPQGIRARETNGLETRRFLYSREDLIAVYDQSTPVAYFAHGPGIDEPLAQQSSTGDLSYLHHDGIGSVTALSTASGQLAGMSSYAPFGAVEMTSGLTSRYGYAGRELTSGGLMYNRARHYHPDTGRFVERDPFRGALNSPSSQHGYVYGSNNPLIYTDPTGYFSLITIVVGVIFGAVLGALIGGAMLPFENIWVARFWGAMAGAVVALVLLGGVGSFLKLGGNFNLFIKSTNIGQSTIEFTLFSRIFGRFFGIHYGTHVGGKILLHIHGIGKALVTGGWAVLITVLALILVLVAVVAFIYSLVVLYYE